MSKPVTWRVECFRLGRTWSGSAVTLTGAQAEATKQVRGLNRPDLKGLLATVVREGALGTKTRWNLRVEAHPSRGKGPPTYHWEEVTS